MTQKQLAKFGMICTAIALFACIHSLCRVGYSIFPIMLIPLEAFQLGIFYREYING